MPDVVSGKVLTDNRMATVAFRDGLDRSLPEKPAVDSRAIHQFPDRTWIADSAP